MPFKKPNKNKGANLKEPIVPDPPKEKEHLTISLRYLRPSHCINECEQGDVLSFVEKIRVLTTKSWLEIGAFGRHGMGYEKIKRTSLNVQVPDHVTPDVNILAFRFSGMKPMVGYKDGEAFYVLWFDRDFNVYNHS